MISLKTGLLYSELYTRHVTGPNHPERPERIRYAYESLKREGVLESFVRCEPAPADPAWIEDVHSPAYVGHVRSSCLNGSRVLDSLDTEICHDSYEVARLAAGGVLSLVDGVMDGRFTNAFAMIRPPGHHAEKEIALGFCLFNHVAIAARYIQKKYGFEKVLIVDWDVHHGNGTQNLFYEDGSVFYFSVHQYPFYPGTGSWDERGKGGGLGATLNVPLQAGCGDAEYGEIFERVFYREAVAFDPDFVLISCGFDAHQNDPLGHMNVTRAGYRRMTEAVKAVAERCAGNRIISLLEGGYNLEALAESCREHLEALSDPEVRFNGRSPR
ncbi:MAG: histone deacetylase [Candidatus Omnitrophica bacterium]|nr:histone deacetylase [Candidatus Omnitrophota bacterium]